MSHPAAIIPSMSNVTPLTRPPVAEERPYRAANSDGTVNVGSYEVAGALDAVRLAHRLWIDEHDTPPDRAELRYLALMLHAAVDATQLAVVGQVDRMAASHNRAHRAVRTALDAHPVPWGASHDDREAWWRELVDRATLLLELAVDLVDRPC